MSVTEQELKSRYAQLSDEGLLDLWHRNTLTQMARQVLQAEFQSRRMRPPAYEDPAMEAMPGEIEPWVTIARLTTATDAHILRARLESEDIPALVADEHLVTANWFLSNAIGGVRVQVPQSYVQRAEQTQKDLDAGNYALSEPEEDVKHCPKCGSEQIGHFNRSRKVSFLALFFFQLPLPFNSNAYKCKACGHVWTASE